VATLPGIVDAALAMPDVHQGYGFPVGGVAATAPPDGVVSPGGVGYDINCGVRLLALPLTEDDLGERRVDLVHQISREVPAGAGQRGMIRLPEEELEDVLVEGARALVERHGVGFSEDLEKHRVRRSPSRRRPVDGLPAGQAARLGSARDIGSSTPRPPGCSA
jgi:tRNA-splicing ligase RtcB